MLTRLRDLGWRMVDSNHRTTVNACKPTIVGRPVRDDPSTKAYLLPWTVALPTELILHKISNSKQPPIRGAKWNGRPSLESEEGRHSLLPNPRSSLFRHDPQGTDRAPLKQVDGILPVQGTALTSKSPLPDFGVRNRTIPLHLPLRPSCSDLTGSCCPVP